LHRSVGAWGAVVIATRDTPPEFEKNCLEYMVRSLAPEEVAFQMKVLVAKDPVRLYPIENHPDSVVPKYEKLFSRTLAGQL
jgi:hypothetical protein